MSAKVEKRIRLLLCVRHKLEALLIFGNTTRESSPEMATPQLDEYLARGKLLHDGIDGLLLLVSDEERSLLELHLVAGMKWLAVMDAYRARWPAETSDVERTYELRQKEAIRKMSCYVERYASTFDFSWLDDPLIDELIKVGNKKQ